MRVSIWKVSTLVLMILLAISLAGNVVYLQLVQRADEINCEYRLSADRERVVKHLANLDKVMRNQETVQAILINAMEQGNTINHMYEFNRFIKVNSRHRLARTKQDKRLGVGGGP